MKLDTKFAYLVAPLLDQGAVRRGHYDKQIIDLILQPRGIMQTTSEDKGIPFLEAHEGVVLNAYRCPGGKWTIGAGLTAASGVVAPHAGMTITRAEARRLLKLALARNYEPAVRQALRLVPQHAFDGAVSFHFNTGAIGRASWVESYKADDTASVRSRLALWNKGGGRVLPGLQRRRREEADAILLDRWPNDLRVASGPAPADLQFASFVISVTSLEIADIREAFREVGFEPGATVGKVDRHAVLDFQRHFSLTVDGLIGKQTLSALQRELDARRKSKQGGAGAAGGAAVAGGNEAVTPAPTVEPGIIGEPWITAGGVTVTMIALLFLAYLAWHYRDLIAARVQGFAPRLAGWLRSF
jgi:lysozyme